MKSLLTNWLIQLVNKSVAVVCVASLFVILIRWRQLPPMVPLWYSSPWGSDQLAHPAWLFLLPLGSFLVYGINRLLSLYIVSEYLIFAQLLFLTSLLVSLLSFTTLIKILLLVT